MEKIKTLKQTKKLINNLSKETLYYNKLFDNLELEEVISIHKSNKLNSNLRRQIKMYIAIRSIKETLPIIAITAISSIIIEKLIEMEVKEK